MSGYTLKDKDEERPLLLPFCPGERWPRTLRDWRVARVLMRRGSLESLLDALKSYIVALYSDGRESIVGTLTDRRLGPWMGTVQAFVTEGSAELQVLPALSVPGPCSAPFEVDEHLRVVSPTAGQPAQRAATANDAASSARKGGDESTIVLDAHLAFGSGIHPTTRLCAKLLREIEVPPSALDIGCGSGILTLVAARCRASVVAVDPDPYARAVCRHNLEANGLRMPVIAGLPRRRFPLIIANLWPEALGQLADDMKRRLLPGGLVLASGAHDDDMARLIPKLHPLAPLRVASSDGWGALLFKAP